MPFLRHRLKCFYCNKPTSQQWSQGLKSFHCQLCDATNHLDDNGEITDPPTPKASRTQSNARFAHPLESSRSASPSPATDTSPFCHTCTSNLQFIRQSLAEYLPAPTDPRYREYERNYESYKRGLEARYPTVCAECEPKIQEQLQLAGYKAKSDYMKRMLSKTKTSQPVSHIWTRKHVLGYIGFPLWALAVLLQLTWHIFGILAVADDGLRNTDIDQSLLACAKEAMAEAQVEQHCLSTAYGYLRLAMIANLLTIWWNPIMLRSTNRVAGLGEFYKLQLLLLGVRYAAWHLLSDTAELSDNSARGVHALLLVLNLAITTVCILVAQPKARKPVKFTQQTPSLLSSGPEQRNIAGAPDRGQHIGPRSAGSRTANQAFPIARLGIQPAPKAQLPETFTDTAHDDPDAMDIDQLPPQATMLYREGYMPEQASALRPRHVQNSLKDNPAGSTRSKKRGKSARSRDSKLISDWMSVTTAGDEDTLAIFQDDDDDSPLDFDRSFVPASMKNRKHYDFAGPKLNVETNETGLEGMFKDIFGLRDTPLLSADNPSESVSATTDSKINEQLGKVKRSLTSFEGPVQVKAGSGAVSWIQLPIPLLTLPIFVVLFALTAVLAKSISLDEQIKFAMLGWIAAIGLARLHDALDSRRPYWEFSNVLIYAGESLVALALVYAQMTRSGFWGSALDEINATSTRPHDPVAGNEVDMLEGDLPQSEMEFSVKGTAAGSAVQILNDAHSFFYLFAWMILQEAMIGMRYPLRN